MAEGPIELLSRARAGETEALGELCSLYRNYLRMVVRTGLGPRLRERLAPLLASRSQANREAAARMP